MCSHRHTSHLSYSSAFHQWGTIRERLITNSLHNFELSTSIKANIQWLTLVSLSGKTRVREQVIKVLMDLGDTTGEWRKLWQRNSWFLHLTKCYSGDQIKKRGAGRACGTYRGRRCAGFRWGNLKTPGAGGRIILEWTVKKQDGIAWTRVVWLGTKTNCELMLTR